MKKIYLLAGLVTLFFVACDSETDDHSLNETPTIELKDVDAQLIEAGNAFTFNMFAELEKEYSDENIFFAPMSMTVALAMALNGANGDTKQEIKNVIDYGDYSDSEINESYKKVADYIQNLDDNVQLSLANSAWYKQEFTLLSDYKSILNDYYSAEIQAVDFLDAGTIDIINDWIELKTEDKIKDLISELDPTTALVLVNAIYFNGTWKYEFDEELTESGIFYGVDNSYQTCNFMQSGTIKTKYSVAEEYAMVALPYGDGNFEMVFYMPYNNSSFETVFANFDASVFNALIDNATEDSVSVYLPKFKIETETIELNNALKNLGMQLPFSLQADFKNIFADVDVFISKVLHKAYIDVNEKGTEAAAATAVIFEYTSSIGSSIPIIYFNQPFAFFIREKETNQILFAGKLIQPEYSE